MQETYMNFATEELVGMYQSSHNEDYLQEIMRRNRGLLHKWAYSYNNIPYLDEEDLLEEGYIACWKAVSKYNIERSVTFSTFLKVTVHQHYNRLYNEVTRKKRFAGAEPISYEALEDIHKESYIEFELLSDLEVREFISSLDGKVQYIATMLLDGYTKGDIARALGITPASTTYHIKRLEKLVIEHFRLGDSHSLSEAI